MSVDWNKPLQSRRGWPVRLLGVLKKEPGKRDHAIAYTGPDGLEWVYSVYPSGLADGPYETQDDIINVPEVMEIYMPILHKVAGDATKGTTFWRDSFSDQEYLRKISSGAKVVKVSLTDGVPTSVELV